MRQTKEKELDPTNTAKPQMNGNEVCGLRNNVDLYGYTDLELPLDSARKGANTSRLRLEEISGLY